MPRFQFRFESLLTLRGRERDEAGKLVGDANEAIRRVREQINEMQSQRDQIRIAASQSLQQPGRSGEGPVNVSVEQMLHQGRYDLQLAAEQAAMEQTCQTLGVELARRQDLLVEAEAEVKRLERLRESQLAHHRQEELKSQQQAADDLTSARITIQKRNEMLAKRKLSRQTAANLRQPGSNTGDSSLGGQPNRLSLAQWARTLEQSTTDEPGMNSNTAGKPRRETGRDELS